MRVVIFSILVLAVMWETTVVSFPITVVCVVICSLAFGSSAAWQVWGAGIAYDMFSLRPVGQTSAFFLILLLISSVYQKKFVLHHTWYSMVFLVSALGINRVLFFRSFDIGQLGWEAIGSISILFIVNRWAVGWRGEKRLSV